MKNIKIGETIWVALILILFFLLNKEMIPSVLYLIFALTLSVYFFPIKFIKKNENLTKIEHATLSLISSYIIILSYVSYLIGMSNFIKILLIINSIVLIYLIFILSKNKAVSKIDLINTFLIFTLNSSIYTLSL